MIKVIHTYSLNPMSRKKIPEGLRVSKSSSINSLLTTLEDPRSLLNLVPEDMAAAILKIPEDLLHIEEDDLRFKLRPYFSRNGTSEPTAVHDALRVNFWLEHDRVLATRNEMMNIQNVYLGVCSREYWHKVLHEHVHVMAWILCKPPQYEAVMNSLLVQSTKRLRDFLNIPLKREDGDYQDPKILDLILKAAAIVDLRVRGGYLQRSETKNLTLMEQRHTKSESIEHSFNLSSEGLTADQMQFEIKEQIKKLEETFVEPLPLPKPKFEKKNEEVAIEAEFKNIDGK